MGFELKVPSVGESITEVVIGKWLAREGDWVAADANVVELETDKVNAELPSPVAGRLTRILKTPGQTARVGEVIAVIEPEVGGGSPGAPAAVPAPAARAAAPVVPAGASAAPAATPIALPAAQRALAQAGLTPGQVTGTGLGGRVLVEDVARHVASAVASPAAAKAPPSGASPSRPVAPAGDREEQLVPLTPMRKRIAERLVQAQQTAAMLTTFNEVDMAAVMALRKRHQEAFTAKHGVKLGFMSFFVKASIEALKACPELNAAIEGEHIRHHGYYDIGVAVGSGRGLVVPVLRNAERMSFAGIEKAIADFGARARERKLTLEELQGGTFTISNGGVYGSMLSTPILNGAQSGILGMHNIVERPVAVDGQVVIRPVMYLALTYDHRLVDGREAVTFLVAIKQALEDPARILLEV